MTAGNTVLLVGLQHTLESVLARGALNS